MLSRQSILSASLLGASIILSLGAAAPVAAHDAPRVETEVKYIPTGDVEVVHVLQLSAAQRLLYRGGIIETNDLSGLRARAQSALYASERFDLMADGVPVPLEILGAEIGGGHLYIYQTGQLTELPETWSARNAILRDLSPRFDNVINVPTENGIRSIVFSGSDMDAVNTSN